MHLFLRSDLVKGKAVGVPCPHGGGVECLMHGGTGQATHTPRTATHDDPFGGHKTLVAHDLAVEPYNASNYHPDSKPLKKPLSPTRARGLASRVVEASKPYHEDPEKFDKLPEHHRQSVTDGLRAANEVLRRSRSQRGLSSSAFRRMDDQASRARYMHRDLNSRKAFADLTEERKKYKVPLGHLKEGSKKKDTEVSAEVEGNDVPKNMDAAHEALFHRIFGEHTFDELHNAYSLKHPKYNANLESLSLSHNYGRNEANLRGVVRHHSGEVATDPTFTRTFTRKPDGSLHVYHGTFFIKPHHQNQGIAGKVFKNSFGFYQKAGVNHVEVQPVEVGKYTWARMGFHWGHGGTEAARRELPMYLRDHHDMDRVQRHKITAEIAHKPWEVAKLEQPLPEKNEGSGEYGHFKYMGREEHPRKPGQYKYKYWNSHLGVTARNGNPLTIEGSNAPADHPHHDPSKGAPRINAGQDFLLSRHGARVWDGADQGHGHIVMDPKDPGYQNVCEYLGLKPEDATGKPQKLADYHTSEPHQMPEHERDEGTVGRSTRGGSSTSSRRGTCSNCGEETESRHDSYCPSCQQDKEKHEALMEKKREEEREREAKKEKQEEKRRNTLNPGDEVQSHHVQDAMPIQSASHGAGGPSIHRLHTPQRETVGQFSGRQKEEIEPRGPLSELGTKIHIHDDPRYQGKWALGKDRHWRPIRVGKGERHLPWTVLHALAQQGRVHRHDDRGSYTPDYRQTHLHEKIGRKLLKLHPNKPSGLLSPQVRKWRKYEEAAWDVRRRGGRR